MGGARGRGAVRGASAPGRGGDLDRAAREPARRAGEPRRDAVLFASARRRPEARALWWAATGACWLFALGSRETAVALPVAIALCEWLLAWRSHRRGSRGGRSRARSLRRGRRAVADGAQRLRARALREPRRVAVARSPEPRARSGGSPLRSAPRSRSSACCSAAAVAARAASAWSSFARALVLLCPRGRAAIGAPPLAAEHRNYLALIGPALGAAWAIYAALSRGSGSPPRSPCSRSGCSAPRRTRAASSGASRAALWDDAVAKSPRNATARVERGALREAEGRASEALADFERGGSTGARLRARARARLAAILAGLGREREALPHAREAVALDPESAAAHAALGRTLASLGELEPAAAAFARALELGGGPGLERSLGDTLVRLGRFEESLAALSRGDRARPGRRRRAHGRRRGAGRARRARARRSPISSRPSRASRTRATSRTSPTRSGSSATPAARSTPLRWRCASIPRGPARRAGSRGCSRSAPTPSAAIPRARCGSPTPRSRRRGAPDPALLDARAAALAAAGRFADARADAERAADLARESGDSALAAQRRGPRRELCAPQAVARSAAPVRGEPVVNRREAFSRDRGRPRTPPTARCAARRAAASRRGSPRCPRRPGRGPRSA